MADVWNRFGLRQRKPPKIDEVMRCVESTCREYDKGITRCVWVLLVLIAWFVVAGIARVDDLHFVEELQNTTSTAYTADSRHDKRLLHRVLQTMHDACDTNAALNLIIGPQVHVNGKPYLKRVLTLCKRDVNDHVSHLDMVNPVIAVTGSQFGTCIDEIDGKEKSRQRPYPITLHSDGAAPHTVMELEEACTILQSLDVMNGIW